MNKKYVIDYWPAGGTNGESGNLEQITEIPTREEAEIKQAELAEEGYGSVIREIRV